MVHLALYEDCFNQLSNCQWLNTVQYNCKVDSTYRQVFSPLGFAVIAMDIRTLFRNFWSRNQEVLLSI